MSQWQVEPIPHPVRHRRLVYYETFEDISNAIHREKRIKTWPRRWKIYLIEARNPAWDDLYETLNC